MNSQEFNEAFDKVMRDLSRKSAEQIKSELTDFEETQLGDLFGVPCNYYKSKTMFESMKCKFKNYAEKYSRVKTLEVLRGLSDRQLVDAGISPQMVRTGISAYPWRENEPVLPLPNYQPKSKSQTSGLSSKQLKTAEAQLRALSNRELADIGLSRGQIPYAVRYGKH